MAFLVCSRTQALYIYGSPLAPLPSRTSAVLIKLTTKCQIYKDYRLIWLIALSIHSFAYCWCAHSICAGMTGFDLSSTVPSPWKKTLLRRNSAKPRSKSVVAVISNSPSDSRCPSGEFSGESPHRISIAVGVLSSTTKWSVISVPLSYEELRRACRSHSWWAVVVLLRYLFCRYSRWTVYPVRCELDD